MSSPSKDACRSTGPRARNLRRDGSDCRGRRSGRPRDDPTTSRRRCRSWPWNPTSIWHTFPNCKRRSTQKKRSCRPRWRHSSPRPIRCHLLIRLVSVLSPRCRPRVKNCRSKYYDSTYECYAMGMYLGGLIGRPNCRRWCSDRGIAFKNAMEEGTDSLGGYAVPDPLAATIVRLVEQYGVFRSNARPAIMTSDTLAVPAYAAGLTVLLSGRRGCDHSQRSDAGTSQSGRDQVRHADPDEHRAFRG